MLESRRTQSVIEAEIIKYREYANGKKLENCLVDIKQRF